VPAPRKYPQELRERAVRLCLDALADPTRARGCRGRVGDQLGIDACGPARLGPPGPGRHRRAAWDEHQRH